MSIAATKNGVSITPHLWIRVNGGRDLGCTSILYATSPVLGTQALGKESFYAHEYYAVKQHYVKSLSFLRLNREHEADAGVRIWRFCVPNAPAVLVGRGQGRYIAGGV